MSPDVAVEPQALRALRPKRLRIAVGLPLAELLRHGFRGFHENIGLIGHASVGKDVGSWHGAAHDDLVLPTARDPWTLENRRTASLVGLRRLNRFA